MEEVEKSDPKVADEMAPDVLRQPMKTNNSRFAQIDRSKQINQCTKWFLIHMGWRMLALFEPELQYRRLMTLE